MALFSLKKISEEASNRRVYLRGVECYNAGRVQNVVRQSGEYYPEYLMAEVESSRHDQHYHVEVGFNEQGEADYYECTCSVFHEYEGACKHIIALMVHKYYNDMVNGMRSGGGQLQEKSIAASMRTDEAAKRMIDRYMSREAVQTVVETTGEGSDISIQPVFQWGYKQGELTFLLNRGRQYVIKDISKFCADMHNHETVEYGKQLRFLHHPDSFEPDSRPLLAFLLERYEEITAGQRSQIYSSLVRLGRELPLTPAALDQFFELYAGKEILWRDKNSQKNMPLRMEAGTPHLPVEIIRSEEKQGFTILCGEWRCLSSSRYLYVQHKDTLYRCDEGGSDSLRDFLAALQAGSGELFIADGDIAAFCTSVLPAIRPFAAVTGSTELLEEYLPEHLDVEVYLDAPENTVITAKVVCRYGEEKINPYQYPSFGWPVQSTGLMTPTPPPPVKDTVIRDKLGELKARLVIQKYFTGYLPEEEQLILRGDDDAIYRFITDGVAEIDTVATIFATSRFSRIGVIPPPTVSVGVRLESNLLDLDFSMEGMDMEELSRVLKSYRLHRKFHRLQGGQFVQLDDTALSGLVQIADGLDLTDKELQSGQVSVPKYRAMYLDKVLQSNHNIHFRRDGYFKELVKNMKSVSDNDFILPDSLEPVLRNYQKTGYRWLKTMELYGFGGILADDMGLGKTLQVISLLLDARQQGNALPSLVVCPASLVLNWESEIRRFAPALTVLPIIGDAEQRAQCIRRSIGYDVAITSYDLLKRDIEQYQGKTFRYHILDEAQYIKNHHTQNAKSVKAIHSIQRYALTGTPIENRLSELWSIFDFLMPGFLYSYARFKERFELPITKNRDDDSLSRLSRMTAPFVLRRLKREVLKELPEKTETILTAVMDREQESLYMANAASAKQQLQQDILKNGMAKSKMTILSVLTRLRQICCDPSLCYEDYNGGSAKLETCMELLKEATAAGHKVLLFSQFTSMLDIIRQRLEAEGIRYYLLQGSTPKEKRLSMVDSFNQDDTEVFLISLKAGGTGLNLTGADVVIHYDPWWNVSAQNQATDRAHRIGQKNSVQVFKLIARDTIEEKIMDLQQNKKELADAVIREGDGAILSMTGEELLELLD